MSMHSATVSSDAQWEVSCEKIERSVLDSRTTLRTIRTVCVSSSPSSMLCCTVLSIYKNGGHPGKMGKSIPRGS